MLFSSFEFLFRFLPIFLLIYYLTPKKYRNVTLFGGSIVFYTIGEASYIMLLLACVLVNYTLTRLMYRKSTDGRGTRQKLLLLLALGYDLGVLFFFKYSGLAPELPLGISFYTFQAVGYLIDCYRGRHPAEKNYVRFLLFISFFPQLVQGPINRYGELENKAQREKARLVAETFRGYADIEINNAFPMMLRSFDRAMDRVIRTRLRETAIGMLPQAFTEIGLALGMALLVALSLGAEEGRAQLLFGVFAVAALRLMPSVRSIMAGWTSIKYNRYTIAVLRDATAGDEPSSASPDTLSDAAERAGKGPHTDAAAIPPSEYSAAESGETARGRRTAPDKRTASGRQTALYGQTAPAKQPCTAKSTKSVSAGGAFGACAPEILPFEHEIAVRNLGFRFADDGHELFRGLTLSIRKGERIGIRGASGAGKTTLFNLLLGLYEPTGGEITIDGTPLTAANRRAWQNRIGYVSQNLFIADGSFAANVALGVPDDEIDRGRVVEALEAARLGEFVAGLAKGMDTHVGECGCRLSGGQRQRIGIARALYRRADVLFFDEATSALDSRTEEEINRSIAELAARDEGLTLVVIAHRESSLEYCTRIITIGE